MKNLNNILKDNFGVCSFKSIQPYLLDCRNKAMLPKNAKSVILFVFPYKVKQEKPLNISRYAAVPDYHPILLKRLEEYKQLLLKEFPNNQFVAFADNSPIPEVFAAAKAGLGVVGKNGLLITKEYGSFVFIGELVTDLPLNEPKTLKSCINCGACALACPVSLNKKDCLSAITQKKGDLTPKEEQLIKKYGCIWGCDICAEVCPLNKDAATTNILEFVLGYKNKYTENEFATNRPYAWRGPNVIKRNHNILCNK